MAKEYNKVNILKTVEDLERVREENPEGRYELMDGVIIMQASPIDRHQDMQNQLSYLLTDYIQKNKLKCKVYPTYDIKINNTKVLNPDIQVYCAENENILNSIPKLVIEILSPSTESKDKLYKFNTYMNLGIKEYWIVDLNFESISVYHLSENRYEGIEFPKGLIKSYVFENLEIDTNKLFESINGLKFK